MVLEGQSLERATFVRRPVPGGEPVMLEGLFHRGSHAPAVVVCAPHPRLGGSMDAPVVAELAWAFTRRGYATLRFNYQRVGASAGTVAAGSPGGGPESLEALAEEVEDARAACRQLAESTTHGRLALAGYSFGAAVALAVALAEPQISALALIAPATGLFRFDALAGFERPLFVAAGHQDPWTDRAAISKLLENKANAEFEVVPGADHTFTRGLTDLGRTAADWLERRTTELVLSPTALLERLVQLVPQAGRHTTRHFGVLASAGRVAWP